MRGLDKRVSQLEGRESGLNLPALWVVPQGGESEADAVARARDEQGLHDPEQMQIIWRVKRAA